jgi:hypothetical protein
MKIDIKRLRSDVKRLKAVRIASPIGKVKTGATDIIREHFDELERMHYEDGASWNEIAAGLAAQGLKQGSDNRPLTGRRLTALMHNIRIRAEKLKSKGTLRRPSNHPNPVQKLAGTPRKTVSLAPEMTRPRSEKRPNQVISEEDIRRAELSKHAHLLRKR